MEPIEKNISVVDEFGEKYEATYPKRAKGLVKKGRARFVDDNTICLACPPDKKEDTKMSDSNIKNEEGIKDKNVKSSTVVNEKIIADDAPELTVGYILKQIEKIRADNEHIIKALDSLTNLTASQFDSGAEKAKGIAEIVKCREATNLQLINFYEKLYLDINPTSNVFGMDGFRLSDFVTAIERIDGGGVINRETGASLKNILIDALTKRL